MPIINLVTVCIHQRWIAHRTVVIVGLLTVAEPISVDVTRVDHARARPVIAVLAHEAVVGIGQADMGAAPQARAEKEAGLARLTAPVVVSVGTDQDVGEAIAAFLSSVVIDGDVTFVTGDGSWQMSDSGPAPGWLSPGFPSSAWDEPVPCTDLGPWGNWSSLPLDHGARWVWYHPTGDCRAPVSWGEAWFRLEFNLP